MMWQYHSQQQKILHMEVFWKAKDEHMGFNPFTLSRGWMSPQGWQSPLQFSHFLCFLIPSLTLSSCPSLMERSLAPAAAVLAQAGKHAKISPSNRETRAGLVLVVPRLPLKSTGCARQACPSPADSPVLSPLPSFPSARSLGSSSDSVY